MDNRNERNAEAMTQKVSIKSLLNEKSPQGSPTQRRSLDSTQIGQVSQQKLGKSVAYNHTIGELPNGKPISINLYDKNKRIKDHSKLQDNYQLSLKSQSPAHAKYGYDCIMRTSKHHLISGEGLEKGRLRIEPNTLEYMNGKFNARNMSTFDKQLDRPSLIDERKGPNEKRFNMLNMPPGRNSPSPLSFEKMGNREKGGIYKEAKYQAEYERANEIKESMMMKGLTRGTVTMDR